MNEQVKLVEYGFKSSEVPDNFHGYKIFVISDLHNAPFSEQIIEHIEKSKPDIIVFAGDMVQLPDYNADEAAAIADRFNGKIPMYAVSGNHESQNDAYSYIYEKLHWRGVRWLENEYVCIDKGGDMITLMGIKDPVHDDVSSELGKEISSYIKDELCDKPDFSVVLSHRADIYPYIKNADADLIISGHLHGGVIRLPFIGGIVGDDGALGLQRYEYGYVKEGSASPMIVSGGCDKNPEKMRVFNQPEVMLITIEREG